MNKQKESTDDARALMAATVDVAGEKVNEARKRLVAALERGKEIASEQLGLISISNTHCQFQTVGCSGLNC